MKKLIKPTCLILSVLLIMLLGCTKEQPVSPITEIPINGTQKTIKVEQNGIGITFCLLNDQGQPATVFRQGENFKFNLAIANNVKTDTSMYIVSDFLKNPGLFRVFSSNGYTIGQPVKWDGMDKITDVINQIKLGEKWDMEIPWHETRGTELPFDYHNLIHILQHYFMGLDMQPLSKGKYYTLLTQQFCLGKYLPHPQSEFVCTDTLKFKINFEIK